MTSPKHFGCKSSGMLFLMVAVVCGVGLVTAQEEPTLVVYSFEQFFNVPGVNATNIVSAPPDATVVAMKWGDLGLSEQPIRATNDASAPTIGNSPAFFYKNKGPDSYSIFKLISLSTDQFKGTIFVVSDFLTLGENNPEVEFGVCGGTGSFRDVGGYIRATLVDLGMDHFTYKYEIFLTTTKRYPLKFRNMNAI